ncbi:MAG: glycosyltransferase family 9 protein [Candidatus Eisenbacteria bacterium]|nr:glycosyltransferase family 9 protein [Candidatus Eisenbacteria bacterium]
MRILAIRPRALGDVVLVTPALRALSRGHPDAEIEFVTERRYRPLFEGLEGVDRVWDLERSALGTAKLIGALSRRQYDLAVDFFGNVRSALISRACGARRCAGYALRGRDRAYHVRVPRTLEFCAGDGTRREYAAATHVRLAEAVGGLSDGLEARIALPRAARALAARLLAAAGVREPRRAVGLVAAGTWPAKRWPIGNAAALARALMEGGREVILLAGPGEVELARSIRRHAPLTRELPSCGVGELASVISELGAVAGTDSGPKHLAASLGVPTITWYGPTHPDTWSPPRGPHAWWRTSLPCRGCDRTVCPHWNCMPELSAEHAAELVLDHLERHERSTSDFGSAARA